MLNLKDYTEIKELNNEHTNILVLIYGEQCVPCEQMKKWLNTIIPDYTSIIFTQMSGVKNRDWCIDNNIRTVPTIKIYNNNLQSIQTFTGFNEKIKTDVKIILDNIQKDLENV